MKKIILLCLVALSSCQGADTDVFQKVNMSEVVESVWDTITKGEGWRNAKNIELKGSLEVKGEPASITLDGKHIEFDPDALERIHSISGHFFDVLFPDLQHLKIEGVNNLSLFKGCAPKLKTLKIKDSFDFAFPEGFNPPELETFEVNNTNLSSLPEGFNPRCLEVLCVICSKLDDKAVDQVTERFENQNDPYLPNLKVLRLRKNSTTIEMMPLFKLVERLREEEDHRPSLKYFIQ